MQARHQICRQARHHLLNAGMAVAAGFALVAGLAVPASAQDKTFDLKLAHWVPPSHPLQKALEEWGAAVEKASGRTIPYTIADRRPGDVGVCFADPAKARDVLGWTAEKDVEAMCEDAWRWQSRNPNGYAAAMEAGLFKTVV